MTATSHGISSPPTTVYVHQHIDNISISLIPGQTLPAGPCFSKGQIVNYQATAFSHGLDITASVGPFNWQQVTSSVAALKIASASAPVTGLVPGQLQATADTPGVTSAVRQRQQREQPASGFHHLPGRVDHAGSHRQQHQRHQRHLG